VFNVALDAVTSEQRRIAKAINFGLVFGQTDFGLARPCTSRAPMRTPTLNATSSAMRACAST